jgi:hypothetical protein
MGSGGMPWAECTLSTAEQKSKQPDLLADRKSLTFEQAEGVAPLPTQLRPKEISPELRALLWAAVHTSLESQRYRNIEGDIQFLGGWESVFDTMHVARHHRMVDEFANNYRRLVKETKEVFERGDYVAIFGWIQWVLRHPGAPSSLAEDINWALKTGQAAYRVLDGDTIVPMGSDAERETLERTFADLAATEFHGARAHLRNAAEELTAGNYANSVRESIHAVESVAKVLVDDPNADLSKALAKLEKSAVIHPAMKQGFAKLYAYTNDEDGIRHASIAAGPAVDETDALFMIGACAAFVSYMINKARKV